jgi:hypothetical protein
MASAFAEATADKRRVRSLPLYGPWRFRGHIVDHAVYALDFVDDARRHARQEGMLEGIGIRRHAVGRRDTPQDGLSLHRSSCVTSKREAARASLGIAVLCELAFETAWFTVPTRRIVSRDRVIFKTTAGRRNSHWGEWVRSVRA